MDLQLDTACWCKVDVIALNCIAQFWWILAMLSIDMDSGKTESCRNIDSVYKLCLLWENPMILFAPATKHQAGDTIARSILNQAVVIESKTSFNPSFCSVVFGTVIMPGVSFIALWLRVNHQYHLMQHHFLHIILTTVIVSSFTCI